MHGMNVKKKKLTEFSVGEHLDPKKGRW